jgi:hypothetical protein
MHTFILSESLWAGTLSPFYWGFSDWASLGAVQQIAKLQLSRVLVWVFVSLLVKAVLTLEMKLVF